MGWGGEDRALGLLAFRGEAAGWGGAASLPLKGARPRGRGVLLSLSLSMFRVHFYVFGFADASGWILPSAAASPCPFFPFA